jgi:hypothetical protein
MLEKSAFETWHSFFGKYQAINSKRKARVVNSRKKYAGQNANNQRIRNKTNFAENFVLMMDEYLEFLASV